MNAPDVSNNASAASLLSRLVAPGTNMDEPDALISGASYVIRLWPAVSSPAAIVAAVMVGAEVERVFSFFDYAEALQWAVNEVLTVK